MNQTRILVIQTKEASKAKLYMYKDNIKIIETEAYIGKNGITENKKEGDGKTPKGLYCLGIIFGTHERKDLELPLNMQYIQITNNLYWIDDIKSKYYNRLVDINKVKKDWKSAEYLIGYPKQYEYAVEIKSNPNNIPGKGSAIFLHCSNGKPTSGCVSIDRQQMIKIFKNLDKDCIIEIC